MGLSILKSGKYLPDNEVTNDYFEKYLDTSDIWIRKRTGIESRRISKNLDVKSLSILAVKNLELSKEDIEKIKLVIVTSLSEDYLMPSISSFIVGEFNINNKAMAFDMNIACTGFVSATVLAEKYLNNEEYALIVSAEVLSKYTDFNNRENAILFGDGAGAVLYEKNNEEFFYDNGSIFSKDLHLVGKSIERESSFIEMNGKNIYRFTMEYVPKSIEKTIEKSGIDISNIDYFILHQANIRIIEGIAKRVGGIEKYYSNLKYYGNTSSATIPICISEIFEKNMFKKNQKVLLSGFGGGLSYCTCIVNIGG